MSEMWRCRGERRESTTKNGMWEMANEKQEVQQMPNPKQDLQVARKKRDAQVDLKTRTDCAFARTFAVLHQLALFSV